MKSLNVNSEIFIKLSDVGQGRVVTLANRNLKLAPPANKINRGMRLNLSLPRPNGKPVLLDVLNCKRSRNEVVYWWKEFENGRRLSKTEVVKNLYALGYSVEQAYALLYDPKKSGIRPLNSAMSQRALHVGVATWAEPTWHSTEIAIFTVGDDGVVRMVDSVCVNVDGRPFAYTEAPFACALWEQHVNKSGELTFDAVRRVFDALGFNSSIVDHAFGDCHRQFWK